MSKFSSIRRTAGAAGIALAASFALAACGSSDADGVVDDFLDGGVQEWANAASEGDFDKFADISEQYFCAADASGFREMADMVNELPEDERAMMIENIGDSFDIPEYSYDIKDTEEDGDTATVTVELTEAGEEPTTETIDLVKEDDEWKICGFDM